MEEGSDPAVPVIDTVPVGGNDIPSTGTGVPGTTSLWTSSDPLPVRLPSPEESQAGVVCLRRVGTPTKGRPKLGVEWVREERVRFVKGFRGPGADTGFSREETGVVLT